MIASKHISNDRLPINQSARHEVRFAPEPSPLSSRESARDVERLLIIAHLHERDEPCPACGYNLHGIPTPICPECGTELAVTVCRAKDALGPWLLGLIVTAAGLGFSSVMSIAGIAAAVRHINWTPGDLQVLLSFSAAATISAVTLIVVLRRRTLIMNRPRIEQWTRAAVTCGWMLIVHTAVVWLVVTAS